MSDAEGTDRSTTPVRRRRNAPLLRTQSRQEEIRLACLKGDIATLESLIKGDSEGVNQTFEDGWNLLMVAANSANPSVVKFLLGHGADANKERADGFTPLLAALTSSKGRVLVQQCVQLLVDAGADVSCRSEDGLTPLILAVKDNRVPLVDMLVFQGADITAKDSAGRTAMDIAAEKQFDQVQLTLKKTESDRSQGGVALPSTETKSLTKSPSKSASAKVDESPIERIRVNPSEWHEEGSESQTQVIPTPSLSSKQHPAQEVASENKSSTNEGKIPPPKPPRTLLHGQKQQDVEVPSKSSQPNTVSASAEPAHTDACEGSSPARARTSEPKPVVDPNPNLANGDKTVTPTPKIQQKPTPKPPQEVAKSTESSSHKLLKVGIALGVLASALGAYYAKVYLQKR